MLTNVRETSLTAYREIQPLGPRQAAVYEVLESKGPCTNEEINAYLESKINRITPRTKELRDKGLVKEHGVRKCFITGRNAIAWEVAREDYQPRLV
jgi:Mn-dependent DtxR family transcriptional regulator